jgi:hypothetical protein
MRPDRAPGAQNEVEGISQKGRLALGMIGVLRYNGEASDMNPASKSVSVLTIGHSTRTLREFIALLQTHGVNCVVDVRTVPRSRHNPQFNKASLASSLKKARLGYVHMAGLGGLRHPKRESENLALR